MIANYQKAENEAGKILSDFGVDSPPIPLIDIVNAHGLNILYADFSSIPDGNKIAGFMDFKRHRIVVNKDDHPNRQRFTIAHELGHYLLHKEYIKDESKYKVLLRQPLRDKNYPPEESEANCFAANLLVPKILLKKYKKYPNTIKASLFAVSEDVIKYREKRASL